MPSKQTKSAPKKATKSKDRDPAQKQKRSGSANKPTRNGRIATNPKWKPVAKSTKNYILNLFDSGIKLLMHKVPESLYDEIHSALIDSRNQVGISLETVRVPPSKQDYNHMTSALPRLKESKQQLQQKLATLTKTLEAQEKELEQLENEKVLIQDFGKLPAKHHPLLLEPMENELHLNFNSVK